MQSGSVGVLPIAPKQCEKVHIDYDLPEDGECYLRIIFRLLGDTPYAKSGSEVGCKQFVLPTNVKAPEVALTFDPPVVEEKENEYEIAANGCRFVFSRLYGTLTRISCLGCNLLRAPVRLNLFRAPTDNDQYIKHQWYAAGYDRLQTRCRKVEIAEQDGAVVLYAHLTLSPDAAWPLFEATTAYRFSGDGSVNFTCNLKPLKQDLPFLPRVGLALDCDKTFDRFRYYGLGPDENYNDRKAAAYVGDFAFSVSDMLENNLKPQFCGNRHGYLCRLTDQNGTGLAVWQQDGMNFSALPYDDGELAAAGHARDLAPSHHTMLYLDGAVSGVGTNSCGPELPQRYRAEAVAQSFGFTFKPITKDDSVWLHYLQK